MLHLYAEYTEEEIRVRFIQKCDDLIATNRAQSYKDICDHIKISTASFNQVKNKGGMPTIKMLYNLQSVYKVSVESILFVQPPRPNLVSIKAQMHAIQESLEQIDNALSV